MFGVMVRGSWPSGIRFPAGAMMVPRTVVVTGTMTVTAAIQVIAAARATQAFGQVLSRRKRLGRGYRGVRSIRDNRQPGRAV
jgi:hypothetical protein